ncbi:MAG: type II toxin-antitoxin system RelE/ParE family toxin [Chloroflexota bacterium]|nr:type II toxin-antitoxin system RelE/ParE family toxin [Chloroflexota bacterium]
MWQVVFHPRAMPDLAELPPRERVAILNDVEKRRMLGPALPFPHQSNVRGSEDLRELHPRAGRSAWRGLYRRIGNAFVIAAVGPEAETSPRAFARAVQEAVTRLKEIEPEGGTT